MHRLRLSLAALLLAGVPAAGWAKDYSQAPEVMPTAAQPNPGAGRAASPVANDLKAGPAPSWIWGQDITKKYFLSTEFTGAADAAVLKATCDNAVTLYLNGEKIGQSDEWQQPLEIDVAGKLKAGKNVLVAEVSNEGNVGGFVLKLAARSGNQPTRYVVSDAGWKASDNKDLSGGVAATVVGKYGEGAWKDVFNNAPSDPSRNLFQVPAGFQVERLFTVPKDELGSWVAITFDNKGRLIASDQGDKGLCRITLPAVGSQEPTKIEPLDVKMSSAQGLLYAFDSLYVSVNGGKGENGGNALYRLKDTDGDDQYDEVKKLADIRGGGEHGPHALRLSPDGKSIYIACGNHTLPPEKLDASRIPTNWGEDMLLPRQWDANGHARGIMAPGGWIANIDPEGKTWEMISIGYRNQYDLDFNKEGELFSYDSDMEWDMGSPWYRPTRVVHATSGSEFGWRSGTGCWPEYFVDSLPPAVNIGPGSPVGVTFGYGTKFPTRYQNALFICDWTFGTMYAIHLTPSGSTYTATKEEFVSRTPLPLTDNAVGPDGALYFTVGGRGTQSELYRVTYVGPQLLDRAAPEAAATVELRKLRRQIEEYHSGEHDAAKAVEFLWPHLAHPDRFIRYAARIGLEHISTDKWADRLEKETSSFAIIEAVVGLARQGKPELQPRLVASLERLPWDRLAAPTQLDALRAWQLVFIRLGEPDEAVAQRVAARFDAVYPARDDLLNRELCNLLVYLKSPTVIAKTMALIAQPRQRPQAEVSELLRRNPGYGGSITAMLANQPDEQKIHYAFALRNMKTGWTLAQRKAYFDFLKDASTKSGGSSYKGFIRNMDNEAFDNATDQERLAIEATGARTPFKVAELPKAKGPGKAWTVEELTQLSAGKMKGRNFKNGQTMFAAAKCVVCHRFGGEGGATGPDLTQAAGRFSFKDMAESIVEPNKVISDQYKATSVVMDDGKSYSGRVVSENDETITMLTDPQDSTKVVELKKADIEEQAASPASLMPAELLNTLNEQEVLDLMAYLLSRGNPQDAMFRK